MMTKDYIRKVGEVQALWRLFYFFGSTSFATRAQMDLLKGKLTDLVLSWKHSAFEGAGWHDPVYEACSPQRAEREACMERHH